MKNKEKQIEICENCKKQDNCNHRKLIHKDGCRVNDCDCFQDISADKEKQIKSDCEKCVHDKVCYDCLMTDKCWGKDNDCEHYQPKLPEDSVVISREEYEKLKQCEKDKDYAYKGWDNALDTLNEVRTHLKLVSKETAEKIYNYVERYIMDDAEVELMVKEWFKEEFGCEIKE